MHDADARPYVIGAFIEAVIEMSTEGEMRVPVDGDLDNLRRLRPAGASRYIVVHWPWSGGEDLESLTGTHLLIGLN